MRYVLFTRLKIIVFFIFGVVASLNARAITHQPSLVNFEQKLLKILAELEDGDRIVLPEGRIPMTFPLQVVAKRISIVGKGSSKTLLDFTRQKSGAQALLIRGWDVQLSGLSILHPVGDGVVIRNSARILLKDIRVDMTRDDNKAGAYAVYPVSSRHITMDNLETNGAADAGIYLGQSMFASIRNSRSYGNVTGLNIENSVSVLVAGNEFYGNSAGAFISSLPDMIYPSSNNIVLKGNVYRDNNLDNFADKGALVYKLGSGVGLQLVAAKNIWVDNPKFRNNQTHNFLIASYSYLKQPPAPGTFKKGSENIVMRGGKNKQRVVVDRASVGSIKRCQKSALTLVNVDSSETYEVDEMDCEQSFPALLPVELPRWLKAASKIAK